MTLKLCFVCALWIGLAAGQLSVDPNVTATKPLAFELVSIRQNVSGGRTMSFGATPDGFQMTDMPLSRLILTAYVPRSDGALFWDPKGFPAWLNNDRFDIEARVSNADLPQWQKSGSQPAMLRAMLQQLLADRCHLIVHRELEDVPVYYLVVGKGGPKFKESKTDEPFPPVQELRFPGGGVFVPEGETMHFYMAPMTLLASMLTNRNLGDRPVLDRTGLIGRYDFVVPWGRWTGGLGAEDETFDPGPTLFSAVKALGLKLVPAKGQMENLVLDHIERPSAN
jgi:uncharacterized protein (TIGR03435 family)